MTVFQTYFLTLLSVFVGVAFYFLCKYFNLRSEIYSERQELAMLRAFWAGTVRHFDSLPYEDGASLPEAEFRTIADNSGLIEQRPGKISIDFTAIGGRAYSAGCAVMRGV